MSTLTKKTGLVNRERAMEAIAGMVYNGFQIPGDISFIPAKGGANVCEVTIAACNKKGLIIPGVHRINIWLTDTATMDGNGLVTTAPTGGIAMKAASGTVQGVLTAGKSISVTTKADGKAILVITDTVKYAYNVCANIGIIPTQVFTLAAGNFG